MLVHGVSRECKLVTINAGKKLTTADELYAAVVATRAVVDEGESVLLTLGFALVAWATQEGVNPTVESVVSFYCKMAAPPGSLEEYTTMWPLLSETLYRDSSRARSHFAVCIALKENPSVFNCLLRKGHLLHNIPILRKRKPSDPTDMKELAVMWLQRKVTKGLPSIEADSPLLPLPSQVNVEVNTYMHTYDCAL
jgi:hypothetical protein